MIYSIIVPGTNRFLYSVFLDVQPSNSIEGKPSDEMIRSGDYIFWNPNALEWYSVPSENSLTPDQLTLINLSERKAIGLDVIQEYLRDNELLEGLFTTEDTLAMAQTFAPIRLLLEVGSLRVASELIQAIEPNPIFTQERKDKYILMLSL